MADGPGRAASVGMTIAQARASLPATVVLSRIPATGEYRVTYRREALPSAERREAVAHYTTDLGDAVKTAQHMGTITPA